MACGRRRLGTPPLSSRETDVPLARVLACRARLGEAQGPPTEVLARYDIAYLSGGDPLAFRQKLGESGYDAALRTFAQSGRLIVGASGGAMQLTRNLSLYRLMSHSIDEVVSAHAGFEGLGLVDYELLPHMNRHDAEFEAKVRRYSERMPHDIVALVDGAVVFANAETECHCCGGGMRYRRGVRGEIGTAA